MTMISCGVVEITVGSKLKMLHVDDPSSPTEDMDDAPKKKKKALRLNGITMSAETVVALASALRDNGEFQRIEFVDCQEPEFVAMAVTVVMNVENVMDMVYQSVDMDDRTLLALGVALQSSCPTILLKLDVPFCDASVVPISKGLAENTVLESLDLSRCIFSESSFQTLTEGLRKNKRLRCLKMQSCGLSDDDISRLLTRAFLEHPKTFELYLDDNRCRSKGLNACAKLMRVRVGGLSKLSLSRQNLTSSDQENFDVTSLAEALHKNTSLQKLDLSQNAPIASNPECRPVDAVKIALAFPINTTLVSLNLSSNNLDDKDLKKIVIGLRENSTLESLDLQSNQFTDAGVEILRKQGSKLRLKKLYLCGNRFGMEGMKIMTESIPESIVLDF